MIDGRNRAAGRLVIFLIPLLASAGMAVITGRWWFLALVAVGPILYIARPVLWRRGRDRETAKRLAESDTAVGNSVLMVFLIPLLASAGMAVITGRWWFLALVAVGPILYIARPVLWRRRRGHSDDIEPSIDVSTATMATTVDELCLKVGDIRLSVPFEGIVLGRRPGPWGVVVADSRVSRRHALVKPAHCGIAVSDLGTTNGTTIVRQNERLPVGRSSTPLRNGDRLVTKSDVQLAEVVIWTKGGEPT